MWLGFAATVSDVEGWQLAWRGNENILGPIDSESNFRLMWLQAASFLLSDWLPCSSNLVEVILIQHAVFCCSMPALFD